MKDYYIFKSGRISRKDNSIFLETSEKNIPIPVNEIESMYIFGEIDLNTKVVNFLAHNGIIIHFFNYYGWWTGSMYPRESLLSGEVIVNQVEHYINKDKRIKIAKEFVKGAIYGIIQNLKRYKENIDDEIINKIKDYGEDVDLKYEIEEIMGLEGNVRELYYSTFPLIIKQKIEFDKRVMHPPDNMMNAIISFVNSLVYTVIIKEIYKTQLNPTISYLHKPFERRYSLALDIAEIFKPIYGDRIIFDLLNNNQITEKDFDKDLNFCYLKESGRKIVVKAFDEKMKTTIIHKKLKRKVSYQHIIKLELYKLIKHLIGEKEYEAFKIWW